MQSGPTDTVPLTIRLCAGYSFVMVNTTALTLVHHSKPGPCSRMQLYNEMLVSKNTLPPIAIAAPVEQVMMDQK